MLQDTKNTSNCPNRGHKREGGTLRDTGGFWWERMSKSHLEECLGRSGRGKEVRQSFPDTACPGYQRSLHMFKTLSEWLQLSGGRRGAGVVGGLRTEGWQRHVSGRVSTGPVMAVLVGDNYVLNGLEATDCAARLGKSRGPICFLMT